MVFNQIFFKEQNSMAKAKLKFKLKNDLTKPCSLLNQSQNNFLGLGQFKSLLSDNEKQSIRIWV